MVRQYSIRRALLAFCVALYTAIVTSHVAMADGGGSLALHDDLGAFSPAQTARLTQAARDSGLAMVVVINTAPVSSEKSWMDSVRQRWLTPNSVIIALDASSPTGTAAILSGNSTGLSSAQDQREVELLMASAKPGKLTEGLISLIGRLKVDSDQARTQRASEQGVTDVVQSFRSLTVLAVLVGWITLAVRRKRAPVARRAIDRIFVAALFSLIMLLWLAIAFNEVSNALIHPSAMAGQCTTMNSSPSSGSCGAGYISGVVMFELTVAGGAGALAVRVARGRPRPPYQHAHGFQYQ